MPLYHKPKLVMTNDHPEVPWQLPPMLINLILKFSFQQVKHS
jgi:hypothetical protein